MITKSIRSFLKTVCTGMRFKSARMEESYKKFQKEVEQSLINFTNIIYIFIMALVCIVNILLDHNIVSVILRFMIPLSCLIGYFCRLKWPLLQKFIIIICCGLVLYIIFATSPDSLKMIPPEGAFLFGNMVGLVETTLILSFTNMKFRFFTYFALIVGKLVSFYKELYSNPLPGGFIFSIILIIMSFYVYKDVLDRRSFRLIYDSNEKLQKFEDILSNGFPSSVAIADSNLKVFFYTNSLFKDKFLSSQTENSNEPDMNLIFNKFVLKSSLHTTEISQTTPETLIEMFRSNDFLSQKSEENDVITVLTVYKDNEGIEFYYEIKFRKAIWEEKHAYAIVINDVSEKHMIMGLKMADEQKDRIIATVSHELRTPINGIIGLLEMIGFRVKEDEVSLTYLSHCKSCSKLLLYLVNSILDLSQIRNNCLNLNLEWVQVSSLLEEVRSLYIFQSKQKGIEFIVEKDLEVPDKIFTDRYRLIQILINLLGNAMKFTFKGYVMLKISTENAVGNEKIIFSIEDTGIGIKQNDQSKLFKMFGKLEQSNKTINSHGVGLGLTICNELVKVLNTSTSDEKILFESEYNKGTKFWFRIDALPQSQSINDLMDYDDLSLFKLSYSEESSNHIESKLKYHACFPHLNDIGNRDSKDLPANSSTSNKLLQSNLSKKTEMKLVLLVDDNSFNLMAASFIMEKLGYKTQQAYNGQEGIEMLENSLKLGVKYDLIMTDVEMPILDGLEMSKKINLKIKNGEIYRVPIVAVTARSVSEEEKLRYYSHGISLVIEKPLIPEVVKEKLENLLIF